MVTSHVLAGAIVGRVLRRSPAAAFVVGVGSHVAMDLCPHWGLGRGPEMWERFLRVARVDGSAGLAALGVALARARRGDRPAVLAGMVGAALLDVDKPCRHFLSFTPFPAAVQRFHERIQREAPHRLAHECVVAGLLGVAAWAALRRPTAL